MELKREWIDFIRPNLPGTEQMTLGSLYGGGSSRLFYRVRGAGRPAVLMVNPNPPPGKQGGVNENDTYVYVAGVLRESGGLPPEIFAYDREQGLVLMEDVGDLHLREEVLARGPRSEWTEDVYRQLLEILIDIQLYGGTRFDQAQSFNPCYDSEFMYRAEGLYFAEYFTGRLCGIDDPELKNELRSLAEFTGDLISREALLYRDFQSSNIMLGPDGKFRLLDFQGARLGPPAYDLASLVYDPYVHLPDTMRARLVTHYLKTLQARSPSLAKEFVRQFPFVAVHRLMQVLGAYGKLFLVDEKRSFLDFIPRALRDLRRFLESEQFSAWPVLRDVIFSVDMQNFNNSQDKKA